MFKTNNVERARIRSTGETQVVGPMAVGAAPDAGVKLLASHSGPAGIGVRGTAPDDLANAYDARGVQGFGTVGVEGAGQLMGVYGRSPFVGVYGQSPFDGGIGVEGAGRAR